MDSNLLDDRLKAVAELCDEGCFFADIGTDHGFVSAYLMEHKNARGGLACDIREKPLEKARELMATLGLEDRVRCVLCDGIPLEARDRVDTVIIAGMGGETIIHIIKNAYFLWKENVKFIFQPMTRGNLLRKFLLANGFSISSETACSAKGVAYSVLECKFTGEKSECSEVMAHFGMLIFKDELSLVEMEYINSIFYKLENIKNGLMLSKSEDTSPQLSKLTELIASARAELEKSSRKDG